MRYQSRGGAVVRCVVFSKIRIEAAAADTTIMIAIGSVLSEDAFDLTGSGEDVVTGLLVGDGGVGEGVGVSVGLGLGVLGEGVDVVYVTYDCDVGEGA